MGNNYPKISIITPSYNQGQFLEETILSVLNQNYPNLEYIIIDGDSTDNSVEIIKKYEKHLAYWVSEKDNGQAHAINKGFKKATGDIVCWINSDDLLIKGALKTIANYFLSNPDVQFVNGYTLRIDKDSKILFNNHIMKQSVFFAKQGVFNIAQQSMFWKKELFAKIGFLDESFRAEMDKEFLIRILEAKIKIGHINKTLGAIRIHDSTKTKIGGIIWENDKKKIKGMYAGKYDDNNPGQIYFFLFVFIKCIKLKYLQDFIFKLMWKGKSISSYSI